LQAGLPSVPEADSIDLAAAAMVTGANCRLAQAHISGGASQAGITRDDLSQPVHSGVWRAEKGLLEHLRAKRTIRRSRHASLKRNGLGQIKNAVSISERPASVEDRAVPGHWEGDLIGGSGNGHVATLVECHSRFVMLVKVANKDTESVVSALIKQSLRLPSELYRSLTWDRGKELANHQRLTLAIEVDVYFCDPRCPWQRGSNENTNRLLRQYLPRGTDLSLHSQTKLSAIARQLNERPRKALLYQTRLRSSQNVLQRSVEPTAQSGRSEIVDVSYVPHPFQLALAWTISHHQSWHCADPRQPPDQISRNVATSASSVQTRWTTSEGGTPPQAMHATGSLS
jgi:IS30 family transposase